MEIFLLRGKSGAAKSEFALKLSEMSSERVVELSDFFPDGVIQPRLVRQAREWVLSQATYEVVGGRSVIVVDHFAIFADVKPYLDMARHVGAKVSFGVFHGGGETIPESVAAAFDRRWVDNLNLFNYKDVVG